MNQEKLKLNSPLMCDFDSLRTPLDQVFNIEAVFDALAFAKGNPLTAREKLDFVIKYGPYHDVDRILFLSNQPRRATINDVIIYINNLATLRNAAARQETINNLTANRRSLTFDDITKLEIFQAEHSWINTHKSRISRSIDTYLKIELEIPIEAAIPEKETVIFLLRDKYPCLP